MIAQTIIRERVEIRPTAPTKATGTASSSTLLVQGGPNDARNAIPGVRVQVIETTFQAAGSVPPLAGVEIRVHMGNAEYTARTVSADCRGVISDITYTVPYEDLVSCGQQVYVLYRLSVWGGFGACHVRTGSFKLAAASVFGSTATFTIQDVLSDGRFISVPFTATVTVGGESMPGFKVAQLAVLPGKTTLQCVDNTPVNVTLKNASGQIVTICSGTTLQATASLEGVGPYAFLRQGTHEVQTISFPVTTSSFSFTAVLDTSRGVIPLGNGQATLRVTVEGIEGTANINFTCPYPPPSVTITHPAQDTTIVLMQDNQPILTLQEVHSPTSGKFEPQISWEPSQTINTADYFEQIQDSLVITVKARARNIAEMEAVDSVRITLKKNVLDHFAVTFEKDTVAFTESAKIFVQAKDANDQDVDLAADTKVNIVLRADERYGNLAYKSIVGKEMIDVPYGDANSGQVVFVATGENPIGLEPQKVDIGVTSSGKEGVGGVWVKCKINPPRYAQGGNSPWADDHYDNAYDNNGNEIKIRTLGCALSCMAMVMTAFGDTVNPGELNEWMKMAPKDSGGYHGANVNWDAISLHSSNKGISRSPTRDVDPSFALSTFDSFLEKCELVIAKVFNPKSVENALPEKRAKAEREGNHWVLITKKIGNDYAILDPGRGLNLLSGYGRIYRYVRVFK